MPNNEYKRAVDSMLQGFEYMVNNSAKNTTQIYNGLIINIIDNSYTVRVNGNDYLIPLYGSFTHNINDVVKVFIPQGNMNLAFFI